MDLPSRVIVAADSHSAGAVGAWIEAHKVAPEAQPDLHPENQLLAGGVARGGASNPATILDLPTWRAYSGNGESLADWLYLRPSALTLRTLWRDLSGKTSLRRDHALKRLAALDAKLASATIMTLETLCFEPVEAEAALCDWFGWLPTGAADFGGEATYRKAMAELLRRLQDGDLEGWLGGVDFALDEPHLTADGRPGACCLGKGWSWAEQAHVWSDGPNASLAIPYQAVPAYSGRTEIRLTGWPARHPFHARLWSGSRRLLEVELQAPAASRLALKATLPAGLRERGSSMIELRLELLTLREPPLDDQAADRRRLGFAIETFELKTQPYGAEIAELSAFYTLQANGRVLSLGAATPNATADLLGWLEEYEIEELVEGPPAHEQALDDLWITTSVARTFLPEPLSALTPGEAEFALVIIWNASLLAPALDALHARRWSPSAPQPDIALFTEDPSLFSNAWWSKPQAFEAELFGADVHIGPHWTIFRTGRRT